jgi:hypothetical protein
MPIESKHKPNSRPTQLFIKTNLYYYTQQYGKYQNTSAIKHLYFFTVHVTHTVSQCTSFSILSVPWFHHNADFCTTLAFTECCIEECRQYNPWCEMWWIRVCNERFYGQFFDCCDPCRSGIQRHTVLLLLFADGDISSLCFCIILGFKLSSRNLHCVPVIVDYIGNKPASMTPFMYKKTISLTFSVLGNTKNLRVSSELFKLLDFRRDIMHSWLTACHSFPWNSSPPAL